MVNTYTEVKLSRTYLHRHTLSRPRVQTAAEPDLTASYREPYQLEEDFVQSSSNKSGGTNISGERSDPSVSKYDGIILVAWQIDLSRSSSGCNLMKKPSYTIFFRNNVAVHGEIRADTLTEKEMT